MQNIIDELKSKFGDAITGVRMPGGKPSTDVPIVYITKESVLSVLGYVKNNLGFDFLADITATDEQAETDRFELVYNLYSMQAKNRIRFKVKLKENEQPPTVISIWPGANWAEREVYDMFGIKFTGHPDMRRILMDMRFVGHPLRKDYPLRGYQIFPTPEAIDPALLEKDGVT